MSFGSVNQLIFVNVEDEDLVSFREKMACETASNAWCELANTDVVIDVSLRLTSSTAR